MPVTPYAANKLNDHLWGKTSYAMPTVYVGLFSVLPTITGGGSTLNAGTEHSGGSYARVAPTMAASANESNSNSAQVAITTGTQTTVAGWGLWDASSSGNLLAFGPVQTSVTGEAITLASGIGTIAHGGGGISNVTVKNNTDATTYVLGVDYSFSPDTGVFSNNIAGSAITGSQQLHITYNYPFPSTGINSGSTVTFAIGTLGQQVIGMWT